MQTVSHHHTHTLYTQHLTTSTLAHPGTSVTDWSWVVFQEELSDIQIQKTNKWAYIERVISHFSTSGYCIGARPVTTPFFLRNRPGSHASGAGFKCLYGRRSTFRFVRQSTYIGYRVRVRKERVHGHNSPPSNFPHPSSNVPPSFNTTWHIGIYFSVYFFVMRSLGYVFEWCCVSKDKCNHYYIWCIHSRKKKNMWWK